MSIAAKMVLLLACLVAGFASGVKWHAGQDAIKAQAAQVNQRATERLRRQNSNTAATAHEADKVQIRTEFVPITKEVERVVTQIEYRDRACLTADGLHAINAAIARANGDTGEPGDGVSKPAGGP
jgi:hypothetical protein